MWLLERLAATTLFWAMMLMMVMLSRALLLFVPAKRVALLGGLIELGLAEWLLDLVRWSLLRMVIEHNIMVVFCIFLVRTPQWPLYLETIQWVFTKYLDIHSLFLLLYNEVELSQNGLNRFVLALIVLQELLHVSQSVPKLRFMDQRQLIIVMEYALNLLINESFADLDFLVCSLNQVLQHFSVFLLLRLGFLVDFLVFA